MINDLYFYIKFNNLSIHKPLRFMRNKGNGKDPTVTIPEVFRLETPLFFPMKTDNLSILFNKIKA